MGKSLSAIRFSRAARPGYTRATRGTKTAATSSPGALLINRWRGCRGCK